MKIKTKLTLDQIETIVRREKDKGRIAPGIYVDGIGYRLIKHRDGTQSHVIVLVTPIKRDGEKRKQIRTNKLGELSVPIYGGTWIEYGYLLSALFEDDATASVPNVYVDDVHFHEATLEVFNIDEYKIVEKLAKDVSYPDIIVGMNIQGTGLESVMYPLDENNTLEVRKHAVGGGWANLGQVRDWDHTVQVSPKRVLKVAVPVD